MRASGALRRKARRSSEAMTANAGSAFLVVRNARVDQFPGRTERIPYHRSRRTGSPILDRIDCRKRVHRTRGARPTSVARLNIDPRHDLAFLWRRYSGAERTSSALVVPIRSLVSAQISTCSRAFNGARRPKPTSPTSHSGTPSRWTHYDSCSDGAWGTARSQGGGSPNLEDASSQSLCGQGVVDARLGADGRCWEHSGTIRGARSVATFTKPAVLLEKVGGAARI